MSIGESIAHVPAIGEIPDEPMGFVDREVVGRVREALGRSPVVVLLAPDDVAGVGRTQVAAACARTAIALDEGVVGWVSAATESELLTGLLAVAEGLGVAEPGDAVGSARRLAATLAARPGTNLLILHSVGDPATVRPYLPAGPSAHVLIIGTTSAAAELGEPVIVDPFTRAESVAYLRRRAQLDDDIGAEAVAGALGDLPLGLAVAASAIRLRRRHPSHRLDYPGYLALLGSGGIDAALAIAVESLLLDDESDLIRRLLETAAVLPGQRAALSALYGLADDDDVGRELVERAIDDCLRGALLVYSTDRRTVLMHPRLARVLRGRLGASGALDSAIETVRALAGPDDATEPDATDVAVLLRILTDRVAMRGELHPETGAARNNLAVAYHLAGSHDSAVRLYESALSVLESELGQEHSETLRIRRDLARAYRSAGRHTDAIAQLERVVAAQERLAGRDDPETLTAREFLATTHLYAKQYEPALSLLETIADDRLRLQGATDPSALDACEQLALAHHHAGNHDTALLLLEGILAEWEKRRLAPDLVNDRLVEPENSPGSDVLPGSGRSLSDSGTTESGKRFDSDVPLKDRLSASEELPDSGLPHTKIRVAGRTRQFDSDGRDLWLYRAQLGRMYHEAGRHEESLPLLEQALVAAESAPDPDHREIADACTVLAAALSGHGQLAAAVPLYERALLANERQDGANGERARASRKHLAQAYIGVGDRADEGIAILTDLLTERENLYGTDDFETTMLRWDLVHAHVQGGRHDAAIPLLELLQATYLRCLPDREEQIANMCLALARSYRAVERYPDAIPLLERALAERADRLGGTHADTDDIRMLLGASLTGAGRHDAAIDVLARVLTDREARLGSNHDDADTVRLFLGSAYRKAGRHEESIPLLQRFYSLRERRFGTDHANTMTAGQMLAHAYAESGRNIDALTLNETLATRRERTWGPDHQLTLTVRNNLAFALGQAGRFREAVTMHESILAARERTLGPDHPDTLVSRNNLADAYQSTGQKDLAIMLFEQTLSARERVLGPDHPDTIACRGNLAVAYSGVRRYEEAIALHAANTEIHTRLRGSGHPDTLTSRHYLGAAYTNARRFTEGIDMIASTLAARQRVLGAEHPDTLNTQHNLGVAHHLFGDHEQAVQILEHTLAARTRVLGPDHQLTISTRKYLEDNLSRRWR